MKIKTMRERLLASSMICGAAFAAIATSPAYAQEDEVAEVVVTGSRIVRQDFVASSPITTVTGEQATANADITLDTYLNTLPQVSPAGTTTSNNPGNAGQANVDLRGLGANRNLVLVDGRRPMISANTVTVDINTIPQAMIGNIEVISGGAGATYGADAVAGVVNLKLKENFEGLDFRAGYTDSTDYQDAKEFQFSAVLGGNFSDGKGNAIFGFDRSYREPVTKGQRAFSALATSTTGTPPAGVVRYNSGNAIPLSAVQALFATYGVAPTAVGNGSGSLGFNLDGTLFYGGVGNNPTLNVQNFRYPVDVNVNTRFYPDFYSYNFDAPNLLTLPLDRYSFMTKLKYEFDNEVEVFAQSGWTEYTANQALAPTPVPTVTTAAVGTATNLQVASSLVTPGQSIGANLVVPATNPFIPNDLRTLLNARTGDDPLLVGAGATEPFLFAFRPLGFGARISQFQNTVVQYMAGVKFPIGENFKGEAYVSQGRTEIDRTQFGNINTQLLTDILAHPTQNPAGSGGACQNQNFFGDRPLASACRAILESPVTRREQYEQTIGQFFISGDLFELPAGAVPIVLGAEHRGLEYNLRFLSNPGPFSGFTVGLPEAGSSAFNDLFAETLIPIVKDMPFVESLEVGLGFRYSWAQFEDLLTGRRSDSRGSATYKAELNWKANDWARIRASYQRAVREPNFQELFVGTASAPQIFDPCSAFTKAWQASGTGPGTLRALCAAQGVPATGATTAPGSQANINLSGSLDLDPEKADTYTVGIALSSPWESQWLSRLRGTVDYYNIEIADPIIVFDTNTAISSCFNYNGANPTYSNTNLYCAGIARTGGNLTNSTIRNPQLPGNSPWPFENGGIIKTSGLDFQLDYGFDWERLGAPQWMGSMQANLLVTHVLEYKQADRTGLTPVDYTGTISYFGAGLGTSFPEWKATLNTRWDLGQIGLMGYETDAVSLGARVRYIDAMENRQFRQYTGETFLGAAGVAANVPATYYIDVDATWGVTDNVEIKLGVNNVADQQPRLYAPNVQSGTDPSTYDVIGRRAFGQIKLRF
ncbi:TonB-dependent receptor domain-containing protein [Phenylobacterium sp.]|uniref:TonB-dependent receptor domain-containing protein n=1 Tax=Phenylobacterium sp. TaxID=1871053 RepID=UPI0027340F10|nr:TonB-dependent receptor [Phenylobacterium sp.]MDP3853693.1 TonB-dependent receptor [Phenylobacterium sp.]